MSKNSQWLEDKYKCHKCDYRFATKVDLKMHSYNHYEEKKKICASCGDKAIGVFEGLYLCKLCMPTIPNKVRKQMREMK